MAAERGSAFLLKIGDGAAVPAYATVAGLKTTQLSVNGDAVAITNKGSGGWRELLSGAGVRSVSVAASGIFTGSAAETQVRGLALTGELEDYELTFESGERMRGQFLVTRSNMPAISTASAITRWHWKARARWSRCEEREHLSRRRGRPGARGEPCDAWAGNDPVSRSRADPRRQFPAERPAARNRRVGERPRPSWCGRVLRPPRSRHDQGDHSACVGGRVDDHRRDVRAERPNQLCRAPVGGLRKPAKTAKRASVPIA